ncbi:hypothetical protein [Chitinophaga barathri]|uniref:Rho-binding antiterminator n=1 Tax=Chitinophaga barathri TaxID=1647451 RepID=A0A3N4M8R0_9BACT|nr:hypothetical protein [Chitinophaga barathri]RPD39675.1 hypothetical protein EG028_18705 [Chitinophaga barathri]
MTTQEPVYTPINCDYYDRLEAWATMHTICLLRFYDEEGGEHEVSTRIKDLYALNKAEYLLADNGLVIRLDRLIAVNNIPVPQSC